jgi:hypothetical protein
VGCAGADCSVRPYMPDCRAGYMGLYRLFHPHPPGCGVSMRGGRGIVWAGLPLWQWGCDGCAGYPSGRGCCRFSRRVVRVIPVGRSPHNRPYSNYCDSQFFLYNLFYHSGSGLPIWQAVKSICSKDLVDPAPHRRERSFGWNSGGGYGTTRPIRGTGTPLTSVTTHPSGGAEFLLRLRLIKTPKIDATPTHPSTCDDYTTFGGTPTVRGGRDCPKYN